MPALKNILLSVLLLTVASRVKGNSTTVTLFDVVGAASSGSLIAISAIDVEPNGGTAYVENVEFTITSGGSPITTTQTETIVEAASWLYLSVQATSAALTVSLAENCTLGENGTTAECVEIIGAAEAGVATTTTGTVPAQVVPLATVTVTGPIPTKSSVATIPTPSSAATLLKIFWAFGGILSMFF